MSTFDNPIGAAEDGDVIQKRLKKFGDDSEATEISRQRLVQAEGKETTGFLGSLTDTKSLVHGGMALAALIAGQPGAAAGIAGLDLLQSPGEIAGSKAEKKQDVSDATADLQSQIRSDIKDQQSEIDQNISLYSRDPFAYITSLQMGGATNEQVSQTLGIPDEVSPNWYAMLEDSQSKVERDKTAGFLEKRLEELGNNDPEATGVITRAWLEVTRGDNLTDKMLDEVTAAVMAGANTFDGLIGNTTRMWTPMSLHAARVHFDNTGDGPGAWLKLDGLKTVQDMSDEHMDISSEVRDNFMDLTVFNDDGTIQSIGDVQQAIENIKDPIRRETARQHARSWGWPGTSQAEKETFDRNAMALFLEYSKYNRELRATGRGDFQYPAGQFLDDARTMSRETQTQAGQYIQYGSLYDIDALSNTVDKVGAGLGSDANIFITRVALNDAEKELGVGSPKTAIHRRAAELILDDPDKYYEMGVRAEGLVPLEVKEDTSVSIDASMIGE